MEMVSEKLIERETQRNRAGERESVKWYCWDVQASPDALVPYNIPIPLQQTDAAILGERNPDFSLETQYLHHTNRRIWRECDTGLEYGSFFLSCSATLMFLSLSLLSQNEVFQGQAIDRLRKHILFCRTWQKLSCYLNNMSSAEVARKHYLWNIVWLNSGVKLQPTLTTKKSSHESESSFSLWL